MRLRTILEVIAGIGFGVAGGAYLLGSYGIIAFKPAFLAVTGGLGALFSATLAREACDDCINNAPSLKKDIEKLELKLKNLLEESKKELAQLIRTIITPIIEKNVNANSPSVGTEDSKNQSLEKCSIDSKVRTETNVVGKISGFTIKDDFITDFHRSLIASTHSLKMTEDNKIKLSDKVRGILHHYNSYKSSSIFNSKEHLVATLVDDLTNSLSGDIMDNIGNKCVAIHRNIEFLKTMHSISDRVKKYY